MADDARPAEDAFQRPTQNGLVGRVVAIEKRSSTDFIRIVLETHAAGRIAMPVESAMSLEHLGLGSVRHRPVAEGYGWFRDRVAPRYDDAPAQISLTSGTTGEAKAILLSHRALGDVTDRLVAATQLDASVREYVGVPVTYSFGFGRVRAVAAVGGASYLPERGFRVDEFAAMLECGEVNALSTVPTLLRLVLEQKARFNVSGDRLRWLEIGSQGMSGEEKAALRAIFSQARIVQHYGLTEASRTTFLDVTAADEAALGTVGAPNGSVEVRITDDGRIAVRGPHVADGVVRAGNVEPLADADGWLVTADAGHLVDGRLVFDGRVDDLINVGGIKVAAETFETALRERLGRDLPFAVARGRDALRGELVVVAHEALGDHADELALHDAAARVAAGLNVGDGFALFALDALPRTETGKLRRHVIGERFAERQAAPAALTATAADPAIGVVEAFVAVFGERARNEGASFHSLGGDSLSYVMMLTGLERHIPDLPDDWDRQSVATLETLAAEQRALGARSETVRFIPRNLDTVRGVACALVVALHVVGVAPTEGLKLPEGSDWHRVMEVLDLIRMPLFTAMAGFLYGAMPALRDGFAPFMRRKFGQLLIPLLFATLFYWAVRNVTYDRQDSIVQAYVWGYAHLWYLDALLMMFAFVAFVDTRFAPTWRVWAGTCCLIFATYWALPPIPVLHLKLAISLLPYFLLGLMLYRAPALLASRPLLIVSVAAAAFVLVFQQVRPETFLALQSAGWLRWLCGAGSVIAILRLFPKIRPIERIGAYSFTIYLWHPAANALVRNILWTLGFHSVPLLFCIGLAAGLLLPVLMHLTLVRMPKVVRAPLIGK